MVQEPQGWGGELLDTSHTVLACQLCFTAHLPSEGAVLLQPRIKKRSEVPLTDDVVTPHHLLYSPLPSPFMPSASPEEGDEGLHCVCVKTVSSGIHPKHITALEVIKAGRHCAVPQLM